MEVLYLLIPLSLLAVIVAILLFFRMSATGQFDDDQGPAFSILLDDDRAPPPRDKPDSQGLQKAGELPVASAGESASAAADVLERTLPITDQQQ